MKFKFDSKLDYQLDAIEAVAGIFDSGQNIAGTVQPFALRTVSTVVGNELELDESRILKNILAIQQQNNVTPLIDALESMDFSVEMETGTGKTYVYLRTVLELNKRYGLKKFVVLVPSVAIREGVLKTIQQTKEHFEGLYGARFSYFAYDSGRLSRVREFAQSTDIQIMIMTIQSFNSDDNIMRQTPDRFNGESPLELVAGTRPVVIMDEPQNMESDLSKAAIADLKPLFKLRYSATHKEVHNLVYRLTPVEAYRQGLVKKIEVFGVQEDDPSVLTFRVREIVPKRTGGPTAKVVLEVRKADGGFELKEMTLKARDNLDRKTQNPKYVGLSVNEIDARENRVELSNGQFYESARVDEVNKEAIFRTQIRETIKAHCDKQRQLGDGIKVLSLFFIDKVENYRGNEPLIKRIFEDEFKLLQKNYPHFTGKDAAEVHSGYFSQDRSSEGRKAQDVNTEKKRDKLTYDLIMKYKEQLLSFSEPVSFIFSHSALREGWDNPNIFQICTLNETVSTVKKRQEIGRGLRLAVDINGDRVFDASVNVLTVVANESYQGFVSRLQAEYTEAGYIVPPTPGNKREKTIIEFKKNLSSESSDFNALWEKIRQRTRFNIALGTKRLIEKAVEKINTLEVGNIVVRVDKVVVNFDKDGDIKTVFENSAAGVRLSSDVRIGNIIERIAQETGVTRQTVHDVLSRVRNLDLLFENPEEYVRSASLYIKHVLHELMVNEGLEYIPTGDLWEIDLFEDFIWYKDKSVVSEKSAYERVVFDSEGERAFAESLETSPRVIVFTKLPAQFIIDTPLGTYNPDWAIVLKTEEGDKLYLVRETKFITSEADLREAEKLKILCGKKHFKAIKVDFNVAMERDLRDLIKK